LEIFLFQSRLAQMSKTLLLSHCDLLDHGRLDHPESSIRLKTILSAIETSPFKKNLDCSIERLATQGELSQIHTSQYINYVETLDGKEVDLDHETPLSSGSVRAARLAAGLGLEMVERVLVGKVQNGFVLVRPPGHHARPSVGMGFCVFNNIALAAKHALLMGIKRVLILDWDVHHGNGTQEAFYQDDRVLFIDLHQESLFPTTSGFSHELGQGKGYGYTMNVPLPHSCHEGDYLFAIEKLVRPLALKYQPELILVSAGFDAHETDPLGSMSITTKGYGLLTHKVKELANEICGGKMILFLEGGYEPTSLANNVVQCIAELTDSRVEVENSYTNLEPQEEVKVFIQKIYESYTRQFT
jgi:acetoin utilization deacetylase AcuC-like enzyme